MLSLVLAGLVARGGALMLSPLAVDEPDDIGSMPAPSPMVDISRLQAGRFFGSWSSGPGSLPQDSARQAAETPPAASETSLRLILEGVIVGSAPGAGMAMIANNNQTATYRVGDRLPGGNRVILDSIYKDRVLLENNGSRETLWLYEPAQNARTNRAAVTSTVQALPDTSDISAATSGSYNPVALVKAYQERFSGDVRNSDFLTLSEIVRISPEYVNTELLGYRLSPGEHLKEFIRLGFRTNDVVTRINGIPLNDITNLQQLFREMTSASHVSVSLLREGEPLDLSLSLDNLPRLESEG